MSRDPVVFQEVEGDTPTNVGEIVRRRFGRDHARKCVRPNVLTCSLYACQIRNRCKEMDGPGGTA